jgi:phospholipid/cholesterol/gamma-HCH transport system substrate-binding protein
MKNLESSSKGLDQNMEAAKDNILLRGYFKRKKRDAAKK